VTGAATGGSVGGLTSAQVAERVSEGKVNRVDERSSRTLGEIVRANVFTRFNAIIAVLVGVVVVVGDPRDALFGVVMVLNAAIGVVQEWRAKSTLDRLSLLSAPRVTVWRDGVRQQVPSGDVVLDDTVELAPGDQIVVDGDLERADGLSVDESLLTGEADAVEKRGGDAVLSGSFVVAGGGRVRATSVGADSYAARLTAEAKQFRFRQSELARGIDTILRVVSWTIVPVAVLLFVGQTAGEDKSTRDALIGVVAGVVALVPQGLVLLLSLAQAVAVIRLGRKQVLVQQLQAVETLARVTVLATDKTGTLTTGEVRLEKIEPLGVPSADVDTTLAAVAGADEFPNATMRAIGQAFPVAPGWKATGRIAFDSTHKYSAVAFDGAAYYVGAPEILLPGQDPLVGRVQALAAEGVRVLLLARGSTRPPAGTLPGDLTPLALVLFSDQIRPDAAETIDYFVRDNVRPKVISGDNPATVSVIAGRCHVPGAEHFVDARHLPADPDGLADAAETNAVFGRVTPEAKRSLLHALQARGEVVAMTGDGVNDTLALKDADLGIAMGAGTAAAKSVSQLVLLDNRFSTLPSVVAEGRRVIANIERVARLFVTKTAWAAVLAVLTGVLTTRYPLRPRQLTVVDALTIGIPGFVLSFQASHDPVRPGFIPRVLRFSIPAGVVTGVTAMVVYQLGHSDLVGQDVAQAQSGTTLALVAVGLWVLYELARPLDPVRRLLIVVLVVMAVGAFTIPFVTNFFLLEIPPADYLAWISAVVVIACAVLDLLLRAIRRTAPPAVSNGSGPDRGGNADGRGVTS
jgi:cation-transporting ATPase E